MRKIFESRIQAVIFDMDGVISDTLPLHGEAESKTLAKHGIKMTTKELIKEFNAVPDPVMYQELFTRIGKTPDLKKLADEKLYFFKKIANKVRAIEGAIEFIKSLKDYGFILGVASSAPAKIVKIILKNLSIENYFDAVTSTEEVNQGKPNPDIFLLAAEKLKVLPKNCLVIEDAPRGIEAAKKANMLAVAITTTHAKKEFKNADLIINSFKDINPKKIESL